MTAARRTLALGLLALALPGVAGAQQRLRTRNVVLIVTDGLRWQEVFNGADPALIARRQGVGDTAGLRREFARPDAREARRTLLPFLWDSIAAQGQVYGNRAAGGDAHVTNGLKFSYPGYNEMLSGSADPRVDANDFGPNPNTTVFDWLNRDREFTGHVAAFATWGAFRDIFARERTGLLVRAGWESPFPAPANDRQRLLNELYGTTVRYWGDNTFDALLHSATLELVRTRQPRVLFVGYGETDEWAHGRRYDLYLRSARQVDRNIAELWHTMQAMPAYRGTTTFIITADHGRGPTAETWTDHGREVDGAEQIWLAIIGPDTPARGEVGGVVTQSQVAATIAALLGKDFRSAVPGAAPPLAGALGN